MRKICLLDDHVVMAFAGLTADARILINRARIECQSHKLTVEDPVTLEYITRYIAGNIFKKFSLNSTNQMNSCLGLKQRYTQSNGRRPFGISCLIVGFDSDGTPHLFQTDPSGTYHEWKVIFFLFFSIAISNFVKLVGKCNGTKRKNSARVFGEKLQS